jgi:adenylate kinase
MSPLYLIIVGRQGSGKGTQSALLVERFGLAHVSTGDMLRAAVSEGTEFGRLAKSVMDAGQLVSDDIMNGIVAERLAEDDIRAQGVLLDGFPRTLAQATALDDILGNLGEGVSAVINLDVAIAEVTKRMLDRGREDDSREAIGQRLSLYESETQPLLNFYGERDLVRVIDGIGSETEVFERVEKVVSAL